MKKIFSIPVMFACITAASYTANAQRGEVKLNLNYSYSMPTGNYSNNVISNGSPVGGNGELMFFFNNVLSAGASFGFQNYYQKFPRALYKTGSNEVTSAVLSNSVQSMPLLAKITYQPLGGKVAFIQPYISTAGGISFLTIEQYLGEFGSQITPVSFAAQAGVGVFIPFGKLSASGLRIGANYNYVPYNRNGYGNLNTVDGEVGVYFPLR